MIIVEGDRVRPTRGWFSSNLLTFSEWAKLTHPRGVEVVNVDTLLDGKVNAVSLKGVSRIFRLASLEHVTGPMIIHHEIVKDVTDLLE